MESSMNILASTFGAAAILAVLMFGFPSCMSGFSGCSNSQSLVCQDSVTSFRVDDGYSHDYECTPGANASWEEVDRDNRRYVVVTCVCDPDYVAPEVEKAVNHSEE